MRFLLPLHLLFLKDRLETKTVVVVSVSTRVLARSEIGVGEAKERDTKEINAKAVAVDVGVLVGVGSGTAVDEAIWLPSPLSVLLGLLAASLDVVLVFLLELLHAAVLLELGGFDVVSVGSLEVGVLSCGEIAELGAGLERGMLDGLWRKLASNVCLVRVFMNVPQVLPLEQRGRREQPPGQRLAMQQRRWREQR